MMTRDELLAQIKQLHARLRWSDNKKITPEDAALVKQIRALADRFNAMKEKP